ncbi:hypothetical protein GUJ93_ZPchr0013g36978 [Zizania palustris]|uniref:Uncharacterized protein n=1 Tax=Zizania palustris TaxID=103762 RepID=A0A8J6C2K7_ZIZPA|nr:hypothetical protein GUJ93_ZPchr0013g36978 [Zizania palustris]
MLCLHKNSCFFLCAVQIAAHRTKKTSSSTLLLLGSALAPCSPPPPNLLLCILHHFLTSVAERYCCCPQVVQVPHNLRVPSASFLPLLLLPHENRLQFLHRLDKLNGLRRAARVSQPPQSQPPAVCYLPSSSHQPSRFPGRRQAPPGSTRSPHQLRRTPPQQPHLSSPGFDTM